MRKQIFLWALCWLMGAAVSIGQERVMDEFRLNFTPSELLVLLSKEGGSSRNRPGINFDLKTPVKINRSILMSFDASRNSNDPNYDAEVARQVDLLVDRFVQDLEDVLARREPRRRPDWSGQQLNPQSNPTVNSNNFGGTSSTTAPFNPNPLSFPPTNNDQPGFANTAPNSAGAGLSNFGVPSVNTPTFPPANLGNRTAEPSFSGNSGFSGNQGVGNQGLEQNFNNPANTWQNDPRRSELNTPTVPSTGPLLKDPRDNQLNSPIGNQGGNNGGFSVPPARNDQSHNPATRNLSPISDPRQAGWNTPALTRNDDIYRTQYAAPNLAVPPWNPVSAPNQLGYLPSPQQTAAGYPPQMAAYPGTVAALPHPVYPQTYPVSTWSDDILDTKIEQSLRRVLNLNPPTREVGQGSPTTGGPLTAEIQGQKASKASADDSVTVSENLRRQILFLFFLLAFSIALNVYLGIVARGFYTRYQDLADELRETFTSTA